jgi:hypothetical protein
MSAKCMSCCMFVGKSSGKTHGAHNHTKHTVFSIDPWEWRLPIVVTLYPLILLLSAQVHRG